MELSIVHFMKKPGEPRAVSLPLKLGAESASNMMLHTTIMFEEAKIGMLVVSLYEGRDLKSMDPLGKMDPFCEVGKP